MDASTSTIAVAKQNGRIVWPESPSLKQYFSLPDSIMYYMAMNPPSPEVYNKLIQSCKYFFERNPILVVKHMNEIDVDTKICAKEDCDGIGDKPCCIKIDLKKIKSKFWLTHELYMDCYTTQNFISMLLPKLFRCDINVLTIFHKDILYDEFKYLASFAKEVEVCNVKMLYTDGKTVMLEKILEVVLKIQYFNYRSNHLLSIAASDSIKNILKLQNLGNLNNFSLFYVPQVFNVDDLFNFIEKFKDTKMRFYFNNELTQEYKNQLDGLTDRVIESNFSKCLIIYHGQDNEKLNALGNDYFTDEEMDDNDGFPDYEFMEFNNIHGEDEYSEDEMDHSEVEEDV
uniref:Uncharacterized protein n=1 Tax=Panagrolaimus sp. ES5 TaxID=591445 RepID=A0AC34F8Y0_9BILA